MRSLPIVATLGALLGIMPLASAKEPGPVSYERTVASLEKAYSDSNIADVLLSVAAVYEAWDGHCLQAIDAYRRFFTACGECASLKHGTDRFNATIASCTQQAPKEAPLLRTTDPRAHASHQEIVDLLRELDRIGRNVEPTFASLAELGENPSSEALDAIRKRVWHQMQETQATPEQVRLLVQRVRDVAPDRYVELKRAAAAAELVLDAEGLSIVRLETIEVLDRATNPGDSPDRKPWCESPNQHGYVTVSSTPWSEVYVNGQHIGATPLAKIRLPAGCAKLRLFDPASNKEIITTVVVTPNLTSIFKVDFRTSGRARAVDAE